MEVPSLPQPPLSPSRLENTSSSSSSHRLHSPSTTSSTHSLVIPPPQQPVKKSKLLFEDDDDFAAMVAMAEVESERDVTRKEERVDASSSTNKSRMIFEEDEAFGMFENNQEERMQVDEEMSTVSRKDNPTPSLPSQRPISLPVIASTSALEDLSPISDPAPTLAPAPRDPTRDYTTTYSNISNLNFNLKPGYLETAPIQATTLDGKILKFARRKKMEMYSFTSEAKKSDTEALAKLAHSMLETPYHRMLDQIKRDASLAQKQIDADATNAVLAEQIGMDSSNPVETMLWTDRYRPKRFTDLLGDERIHRSALLWLKEWDQCVFRGSAKTNAAAELKKERRKKRAREGKFDSKPTGSGSGSGSTEGEGMEYSDPLGRPQEKIMLLCGPPGLGKTTLAYVLAQQAGYQVLEVNASDDRTGKVVEDRIRNALESTALTMDGGMKGNKPTCVVIDEIDGAGGGGESSFVRTLVKLVNEGTSAKKYKGKGKKDRSLQRPIICICNDLYAPVLRPLRPLAKIVRFSSPTNAMLVKRLRAICDDEGLGADLKNLTLLAEVAEGDLRSCLNTLQFIKRKSTVVDEASIRSTIVGLKDTGTSSTQVIERLFRKPARKKGGNNTDDRFVHRIVRDVQTCGEYEKISQGCFENYLTSKQLTDTWPRINESLDWLFFYDRLDGKLRKDRDYELLTYVPFAFVPWYKLFSSHSTNPLEYPKADYEAYFKRTAHQEIVQAFVQNMPHSLKNLFTGANVSAELLPLLNRIISPELKPINSQLIKADERAVLISLVRTMLALGLNFVQDKNEDGQLTYKLEPPIDVFVHFDGKRATDIAASRYAIRHMVTREMEAEVIRRSEREGAPTKTSAEDILAAYNTKPAAAAAPVKEAVDFFGRAIIAKPPALAEDGSIVPVIPVELEAAKAVYRFHEGFSNAVRTTKRVSDFLM